MTWCEYENDRKILFNDLIKHIIFGLLDPEFFTNSIINHPLFKVYVDIDNVNNDALLLFGGDNQHSRCNFKNKKKTILIKNCRSIICYNGETDTWRKLSTLLPDPGQCPGDTVQVLPVKHFIFIKRSINCCLFNWRTKDFDYIGSCEVIMIAINRNINLSKQ